MLPLPNAAVLPNAAAMSPNAAAAADRSFLCRGRVLRNLTAAEFSLAHDGAIAPELKRRSSSYYWQTAAQERSRHELICEKTTRWHILTFGSHGNYWELAKRKCHGNGNGGTFAPNRAETRRLHRQLGHKVRNVDTCTNLTVASLPREWAAAHGINASVRGAGYWRWKPYAIQQKLASMGEGEVLAWMDYDLVLLDHEPWSLFCLGQNVEAGVAGFHFPCLTDRAWTKRELADAIGADDRMMDSAQLYGGLVVLRNGPFARRFVGEWLHWATSGLETDEYDPRRQHPRFRGHRHDQSILSLLAKKHRVKTFPLPTKSHDVRDVWSWEAGACRKEFDAHGWPLPVNRPTSYFGYIMHYKEMGHQQDSLRHCERVEPAGTTPLGRVAAPNPWLPLPDYVGSAGVLDWIHNQKRLNQARGRGKRRWTVDTPPTKPQCAVALVESGERSQLQRNMAGDVGPIPPAGAPSVCQPNVSFGCFWHDRTPQLWVAKGCHGVFACEGHTLRCRGPRRRGPDGPTPPPREIAVCSCTWFNSIEAKAFYRDGEVWPKDDAEWV